MTKQQIIHNKWSDLGITLLISQYDFDGWIDVNELEKNQLTNELNYKKYNEPDSNFETMLCRPKSLQGIENNNGWTKIESIDDLPKEKGFYLFLSGIGHTTYGVEDVNYAPEWFAKKYTHWKPKQEHKNPLY